VEDLRTRVNALYAVAPESPAIDVEPFVD
jgi:hypothetical protein